VSSLHRPEAAVPVSVRVGRPRIALRLHYRTARDRRGRRCAPGPVRATVRGRDIRFVRGIRFQVGSRKLRRILVRRLPITRIAIRPRRIRARRYRVRANLRLMDGQLLRLSRTFRGCR